MCLVIAGIGAGMVFKKRSRFVNSCEPLISGAKYAISGLEMFTKQKIPFCGQNEGWRHDIRVCKMFHG